MATGPAWASTNFYAHATASETNVYLGQVFNLDVIVKADTKPNMPAFPSLEFNAAQLMDGQATSAENTWLYRYALRPKIVGELTIPALNFNTTYSHPIQVQALKPESSDRMKLQQTVTPHSVYVGEPVILKTVWDTTYPFSAIKAVDFHFPILNDRRFQILDLHEPDKETQSNTTGLPVHGTRVLATRHSYKTDDVQHQTLEFSKILIPKKSGEMFIGPITLLCAAEKEQELNTRTRRAAFQYPAYFDNTFFDQNVQGDPWNRIYTESDQLMLIVKPLPKVGRPSLFNGMVGEFSIDVQAEPTEVQVGEPITLTIRITASQHVENIYFEALRYQPNLVNRFDIPSDRSLPKIVGKTKIYTQTLRPLSVDQTEIPPLQLAYFNPVKGEYEIAESAAIPLTVSPADPVAVFGSTAYQNRLRSMDEGIRQNYEKPDMLKSQTRKLFGWAHPAVVMLILLLPPTVIGGMVLASLLGEKKHHIQRTAKAARAFKVFRKNIAHIKSHNMKTAIYCDLDECLRAYLADRLHLIPGALSYCDAESKLIEAGADFQTLEELKQLFALCEAYRFTTEFNEPGDAHEITQNAARIIRSVERKLK